MPESILPFVIRSTSPAQSEVPEPRDVEELLRHLSVMVRIATSLRGGGKLRFVRDLKLVAAVQHEIDVCRKALGFGVVETSPVNVRDIQTIAAFLLNRNGAVVSPVYGVGNIEDDSNWHNYHYEWCRWIAALKKGAQCDK